MLFFKMIIDIYFLHAKFDKIFENIDVNIF